MHNYLPIRNLTKYFVFFFIKLYLAKLMKPNQICVKVLAKLYVSGIDLQMHV